MWFLTAGSVAAVAGEPTLERFEKSQVEMAVPVRLVLYAQDAKTANAASRAAFARFRQLNKILSDYDSESELRRLCRDSHQEGGVRVSRDLWRVLHAAQELAHRSDGAFDVTVGPVVKLWRRARRRGGMPNAERLTNARQMVGFQLVKLNEKDHSVELAKSGMRLDLGGIAKGYAIDEAMRVLEEHGIKSALVDAGGDIGMSGPPPGKPGWRIGIARLEANGPPSRYLWLSNVAIANSGDTWQFVEIEGERYSHIIDPRTGLGLTDHSNVTVIAPNCMMADSLASAVSVMGPMAGMKLIEATPDTGALIVRAPDGRLHTYETCRWNCYQIAKPK